MPKFWKNLKGGRHESQAGVVEFRFLHKKRARKYWFVEAVTGAEHGPFHDYTAATQFAEDHHRRKMVVRFGATTPVDPEQEELIRLFGG